MSTQADVDALTASVTNLTDLVAADDAALNSAVAGIAAEIAALQQQNPALDLSALTAQVTAAQSAVSALGSAVDSVSALVPPATS